MVIIAFARIVLTFPTWQSWICLLVVFTLLKWAGYHFHVCARRSFTWPPGAGESSSYLSKVEQPTYQDAPKALWFLSFKWCTNRKAGLHILCVTYDASSSPEVSFSFLHCDIFERGCLWKDKPNIYYLINMTTNSIILIRFKTLFFIKTYKRTWVCCCLRCNCTF